MEPELDFSNQSNEANKSINSMTHRNHVNHDHPNMEDEHWVRKVNKEKWWQV